MPTREELIANGFQPTTYEGQDGEFLAKTLEARFMPHFSKNVADGEYVLKSSVVVVEVCPGNLIQLVVQNSDCFEDAVPLDSDRGQALLLDAGFATSVASHL